MSRYKQNSPSLTGGAGSLNRVNLLGSVVWVNSIIAELYTSVIRNLGGLGFGSWVKTLCITIGFCAVLLHKIEFWGVV